ncbi:MAG: hypothetical protein LBJ24_09445 [Treponema sp.]|nr:hypothetical protein [Treponema sp.]
MRRFPVCGPVLFAGFLILGGIAAGLAGAQDWFVSNAAGMALEPAFFRLALRNRYALSVDRAIPEELPGALLPYFRENYAAELRMLYQEGEEYRRQWIFRDEQRRDRLAAAFNDDGSGFIEVYDEMGRLTEEHQFDNEGGVYRTLLSYNQDLLIKAEARFKAGPPLEDDVAAGAVSAGEPEAAPETGPPPEDGPPAETLLWTDYYRYSRFYSLRAVDRIMHSAPDAGGEGPAGAPIPVRIRFPRYVLNAAAETAFAAPYPAYDSDFLRDIFTGTSDRVLYNTDDQGRVLSETRWDAEGGLIGELQNTWSGDRLTTVRWIAGDDERLLEYEYDGEGNRTAERNYTGGVLERTVRREGDRDVEELYMNGEVILRALWGIDGRKISEERIRPSSAGNVPEEFHE